jgi:hypothetical protein
MTWTARDRPDIDDDIVWTTWYASYQLTVLGE